MMKPLELLSGWLIPGSCYLYKKDWVRGLLIFVLLEFTFVIGLILQGCVMWPVWQPKVEGFNLINILTFLTQMGNGLVGGLSMMADWANQQILHINLEDTGLAPRLLSFFHGQESSSTYELGSFYLLVSGAMNYFSLMGYNDRFYGKHKEKQKNSDTEKKGV